MKQSTQQGHGFFRKSKAYGLVCGIAIAAALMVGTSTVSANENTGTTNNPATNLVVAQPETSRANTDMTAQAGKQVGELTSPVVSQELTNAVETAIEAGVAVTTETTSVAHENLDAAQNDLSAQVHAVEKATDQQTANTEAIKEATETNADIDRQNQAEAERVAKENAQGQAEVDARNAAGQKAVDERNQRELDRRNDEAKAVEARNQAGQKAVEERNKQGQAEVDARNVAGRKAVDARNQAQQERLSDEKKAIDERNKAGQQVVDKANAEGQAAVDKANAELKADYDRQLTEAAAIEAENEKIRAENARRESENQKNLQLYCEQLRANAKKDATATNFSADEIYDFVSKNNTSTILNIDLASDNVRIASSNLEKLSVAEKESYIKRVEQDYPENVSLARENVAADSLYKIKIGSQIVFEGGIKDSDDRVVLTVVGMTGNTRDYLTAGVSLASENVFEPHDRGTSISYKLDIIGLDNQPREGSYIVGVGDLDFGQSVTSTGYSAVLFGDAVERSGDTFKGFNYKGVQDYQQTEGQVWFRFDETSSIVLTYSDVVDGSNVNKIDSYAYGHAIGGVKLTELLPKPPKRIEIEPLKEVPVIEEPKFETFTPATFTPEPYTPTSFVPETFTPEVFTPETFTPETYNPTPFVPETFTPEIFTPRTPTVIPYVNIPEKETFSVAVHPVLVKQTPGNQKMVTNADGIDVNGQLVVKGEWNTWTLTNANLKAGREEIKAYTMIEPFPSGIEIDWEKSLELSPAWLRSTDEQGKTLLSATLATINTLNANRQLDVTIPEFKVVFRALNDGATYKNTFDTKILATNGSYTVTSNTVTIYTPGSEHRTYNGNVVVRYFDETGETKISGDVVDVEDGKVGSSYTTTDNRPDVIAFEGKLYERTTKVVGKEDGKVTDGTVFVDYFYKQVTPTPGQGSVVVHYQDETGKTIKTDEVDEHNQAVGKSYDTTDNRPDVIKTSDGIEYKRTPKVVGSETGKVTEGVTEITYIYTRITPPPTTPTPNDNLIQPEKDVVDEKGQSINGKSVLPNTLLNYVAKQDFDQYKGMSASRSAIAKGFLYVDDYLDEALDGHSMVVTGITAANGDDVRELFDLRHVLSLDTLEDKLQGLIKEAGISPVGEFYLWVAKEPEAFFEAFVQKGLSITRNLSFKIKQGFTGTVTNQTYQIDFGNGYAGNIVTNEVPPLVVHKQVLDKDGKSIDGSTVKLGDKIDYLLEGWVIPAGRGYDINEYRFVDLLQVSHDKYDSHRISAKVGFTLTDGTVIKAKDDLAAFTETIYNVATGRFETRFKEDFLARIPRSEAFGADVVISVERIAAGKVVNEYTLHVNGNPVISNKVTTTTPEPPKPVTPTTPATPAQPQLPSTGDASGILASLAGGLTTVLGLVGFGRKKED